MRGDRDRILDMLERCDLCSSTRRINAWREIAGIRVILAHAYFHVEQDIVGRVIDHDVPLLRAQLQPVADSLAHSEGDSRA